ncbi:hypothetical protein NDU88_003797 [Pleurodeles waltl]|uniref:Uncharacterized protein n=1 Tax=Pleurodeles waltl TaxID=8319 RepID=A0AAV7T5P3_PLEWA|nr:hypothetical protein NDU88_003797 [Pleurodeles waltl]
MVRLRRLRRPCATCWSPARQLLPSSPRRGLRGQEIPGFAATGPPLPPPPASQSRHGPSRPPDPAAGLLSVGARSRPAMKEQARTQGLTLGSAARSSSEPSRRHDSSAAPGAAPSRLRLHRDRIRPLTTGTPFRSAPELLSLTPLRERSPFCLPLSLLRNPSDSSFGPACFSTGSHLVSADPARLTAPALDRLGPIPESDFLQLFGSRSSSTNRPSEGLLICPFGMATPGSTHKQYFKASLPFPRSHPL